MSQIIDSLSRPAVRGWIYNVTIAGLAVAMAYGLLTGEQAAVWLGLVAAVVGMARANLTPESNPGGYVPERADQGDEG